ncbi:VOC family protein [Ancylobacter sp. VNQ12]|uniref:VOC family protein n=1 Tax=Ancylobacter sp. VNQ12 TaxID=3400920 RepID=UPI003C0B698F
MNTAENTDDETVPFPNGGGAGPAGRAGVRAVPPLHVSLITLGVVDLERAILFYEALGLTRRVRKAEGVAFFEAGAVVLSLYPRHELAADAGVVPGRAGQFGGIAIACNRSSRGEVDATLIRAVAAGGRALRPAQATFWGGYSGYVADPDGHAWEVAHNPGFPLGPDGRLSLPE